MTLRAIQEHARRRPEQEFLLNRLYGARVSPYFTVVCLRLGLSPDGVTVLGAAFGVVAFVLLLLPLGWWSLLAVAALQVGYILDFSDGQVARHTGRSSAAGAYLDRLTHFYVPVAAVLAMAASLAWSTDTFGYLVLGAMAALELASFAFSGKEHVLVAMQRVSPSLGSTAAFQAALFDDARPSDVVAAAGQARPTEQTGIGGRRRGPSLRSVIGELLIYPGAAHLLTLAVVVDYLVWRDAIVGARGIVLVVWAALLLVHVPIAVRRNHAVILAVEAKTATETARPRPVPDLEPGPGG